MPYNVVGKAGEWYVENPETGERKSEKPHKTRKAAIQQMRALYANVEDARKEEKPTMPPAETSAVKETIDTTPPQAVQDAAKRGLELRKKYGRGGLSTEQAGKMGIGSGIARANSLAAGQKQSPATIRRMVAFFARHAKNKDGKTDNGEPSAGAIAWLLWGGDSGRAWAESVSKKLEGESQKHYQGRHDQKSHGRRRGIPGLREDAKKAGYSIRVGTDGKGRTFIAITSPGNKTSNVRGRNIGEARYLLKSLIGQSQARQIAKTGKRPSGKLSSATKWNLDFVYSGMADSRRNILKERRQASDYLIASDPEKSTTWHLPVRTNGKPDHRLMGAAWAALTVGYRGKKYKGPKPDEAMKKLRALYKSEGLDVPGEARKEYNAEMSVFKDKRGQMRWILISSNAFKDRDGEIVSTKALESDVERTDAGGETGPLRWWHVDGADIGDCDFRMMAGRMLVESGTFRNPKLAAKVAGKAKELKASIGFYHPVSEPDGDGVYSSVRIYERSLLPANKAANALTKLIVKGDTNMPSKKEKLDKLVELAGDEAADVIANAEQASKEAEAAGIAHKEAGDEQTEEVKTEEVVTEAKEGAQEEAASETIEQALLLETEEKQEDEEDEEDEPLLVGDMTIEEFADFLADVIPAMLKPAKKEAGENVSALQDEIKTLKAKLKELQDERPAAVKRGYVASEDADTVTETAKEFEAAEPQNPVFDFVKQFAMPRLSGQ